MVYNKAMKRILKLILFAMSILTTSSIPLVLLAKSDIMAKLFRMDNSQFFNLVLCVIPVVFSLVLVIFNYMLDFIKKQKEIKSSEKKEYDKIIERYNVVMLKTITNHSMLINELDKIFKGISFLKTNPIFLEIINIWEKETAYIIDLSNDSNFRTMLREKLSVFVTMYKKTSVFDHHLEYLNNLETIFSKYDIFTIEDRVFIFNLRNLVEFTDEEKAIIIIYTDFFNSGEVFNRLCRELTLAINDLHKPFESEIKIKEIDDKKLFDLLYHLFIRLFRYCEILLREIFFMELFKDMLRKKFGNFYNEQKRKHKKLDNFINPESLYQDELINKYIDKNSMYEYYKIKKEKDD
jgi:hypothetical protein